MASSEQDGGTPSLQERLQEESDAFVRTQTVDSLIEWCWKRLHTYKNAVAGELIIDGTFDFEGLQYVVMANYRHQSPTGLVLASGKATIDEERIAKAQLGVDTWRSLLNSVAHTLRQGIAIDLRKHGITEVEQKSAGWYETGKGWQNPGALGYAPPQRPEPVVTTEAVQRAQTAAERTAAALAAARDSGGEPDLTE